MRTMVMAGLLALLAGVSVYAADPAQMKMPTPQKEHEWLKQFEGEWESDVEMFMPGQAPQKSKGTETTRNLGGFWVVSDINGTFNNKPFHGRMALGFDPSQNKYVSAWVDSVSNHLFISAGTVDADGKRLTLEGEGPCPMRGGKISRMRDVTEFKSKDHKVCTSFVQNDDGTWQKMMSVESRRKGLAG